MKKLLLVMGAMLVVTGCTKGTPVCNLQTKLVDLAAPAIATGLACSNVEAIKTDLDAALTKVGLCKDASATSVGSVLCGVAVETVVSNLAGQIPAAWGCTGGVAKDKLKEILLAQCAKL